MDLSADNKLVDPFTTPDSQAKDKFAWENFVYGILFLFFGAVEVLHGYRYIRFTMLVAGFLVWSSTAVMIMLIVNTGAGSYLSSELYFLIWLAVGLVGSVVSFYLYHVGIVLTGAYGAFAVIAVIFTAVNLRNYIARYTLLAIFVILAGYLTKRYERIAVILATSVGGAYMMMYGLDMFVQTGFRGTYHVILTQSTAEFNPTPGTWVMVACVPVIAIFGIVWELHHHETPVGSWWFGIGAKPLPEIPGEKPRRCCGFTLAAKRPKVPPKDILLSGSKNILVDSATTDGGSKAGRRGCCCGLWWKKGRPMGGKMTSTPSVVLTPASPALTAPIPPVAVTTVTMPSPYDGDYDDQVVHGQTKVEEGVADEKTEKTVTVAESVPVAAVKPRTRRVAIDRQEHEFSLDLSERIHP
ncbi:hypothetical protein BG004_001947 [Podila humilis]|nr:hypothetical protein BG004_001947 [Podila humilis]